MLAIYYGEDRAAALEAAKKALGAKYEVIEGENLTAADLPNIFRGASLFEAERRILLKDLLASPDKAILEKIPDYADTPHQIIMLEDKLDKRTSAYKTLAKTATIKEFKPKVKVNTGLAFDIYDTALRNGPRAVQMCAELAKTSAAQEVIGAWTWKAAQNYQNHPGARERRALKALAEVDLQMKSAGQDEWLLLEAFLLGLSRM